MRCLGLQLILMMMMKKHELLLEIVEVVMIMIGIVRREGVRLVRCWRRKAVEQRSQRRG